MMNTVGIMFVMIAAGVSACGSEAQRQETERKREEFAKSFVELRSDLERKGVRAVILNPVTWTKGDFLFGNNDAREKAAASCYAGFLALFARTLKGSDIAVIDAVQALNSEPGASASVALEVIDFEEGGMGLMRVRRVRCRVVDSETGGVLLIGQWNMQELFR